MGMIDFGPVLESRYQERLEAGVRRRELEDKAFTHLRDQYIAALKRGPDGVVHLPGRNNVAPISQLISEEIDPAQVALLLRDGLAGENLQTRIELLVSVLANKHASYYASDLADEWE